LCGLFEAPRWRRHGPQSACLRCSSACLSIHCRVASRLDELVEREFADVYLLIDHLSGRADRKVGTIELEGCPEPGQKANLIDQVCQVRWPASGDQPKPAKQAAVLFKARDKLSELAAPATGLTVAYTLLVAPGRCGKAELVSTGVEY
jgi:hypothetical protein